MDFPPPSVSDALRRVDETREALGSASDEHRSALSQLADEICRTADDLLGSVNELARLVEARRGVPAQTVRHTLYGRHVIKHMTACLEVLADVATTPRMAA